MPKRQNNIIILTLLVLLLISLTLSIKLVSHSQDNRSKATNNSNSELSFKVSFKGIKPNYSCLSIIKTLKVEVVNKSTNTFQSNINAFLTPISNETNKAGDQVFLVSHLVLDSKFNNVNNFNYLRIKGPFHLASRMCLNNQKEKLDEVANCDINLKDTNTITYDFSNYSLIPGDTNQDGTINTLDYSVIKTNLNASADINCNRTGDLNLDGIVNSLDTSLLKDSLSQKEEGSLPLVTNTPSPTPTNKPIPVSSFEINTDKIITSVGKTSRILTSNISPINATYSSIVYTSLNPSIANIDNLGVITGVSNGKTTISIKIDNIVKQVSINVLPKGDKVFFLKSETNSKVPADTIILESNNKYGVIDAGNNVAATNFLKYLEVPSIDFMLLTHWHGDHFNGFTSILNKYQVKDIYLKPYNNYDSNTASNIREDKKTLFNQLKNWPKTTYKEIGKNNNFTMENFQFDLFNTTEKLIVDKEPSNGYFCLNFDNQCNENANSVVALATVKNKKIYFSGDIQDQLIYTNTNHDKSINYDIINSIAKSVVKQKCNDVSDNCIDVYKLAHHGFYENNPKELTSILNPKYAIATAPTTWFKNFLSKPNLAHFNSFIINNKELLNLNNSNQENKILITGEGSIILNIDDNGNMSFITLDF